MNMDQHFMCNNNSFFGNQPSDSFQNPDVFLNLEEDLQQNQNPKNNQIMKIEEQFDDQIKQEWEEDNQLMFNQNDLQGFETFQKENQNKFQQQQQITQGPIKRSMKIKKEKAKQIAAKRRELKEQLLKQQQLQQQQIIQNEVQSLQNDLSSQQDNNQTSQEFSSPLLVSSKEGFNDSDSPNETLTLKDLKSQKISQQECKNDKSMQQKIRNRISAQNSRDRKKEHLKQLEEEKTKFENKTIEQETLINKLQQEIYQKDEENKQLKKELHQLKVQFGLESDNMLNEPSNNSIINHSGSSRNNILGFTFFTIISVIMFAYCQQENSSNLLSKPQNNEQIPICLSETMNNIENSEFEKMDENQKEYKDLSNIGQYEMAVQNKTQEQENNIPVKIEEEQDIEEYSVDQDSAETANTEVSNKNQQESKQLVKAYPKDKQQNLRAGCKNCTSKTEEKGLTIYNSEQNVVTTIFCPHPYQYHTFSEIQKDQYSTVNHKGEQYIQLYFAKNQVKGFFTKIENEENVVYVSEETNEQEMEDEQDQYILVLAKISEVTAISKDKIAQLQERISQQN